MKLKNKDVYIKDDKNFYDNIKKYSRKRNTIIHFLYKGNDIINDDYLKMSKCNKELTFKINAVHAANIKDKRKRYSYIYDVVCDYLDNEFIRKDKCNFCNNKCIAIRNGYYFSESIAGCCYGRKRGTCLKFKNNTCSIKSISCKLFTCKYLKSKDIKYKINDIPLLKYFFDIVQKYIISIAMMKDKEETIDMLIKHKI